MARLTASQRAWRDRLDLVLLVLGPPLDVLLAAAERASRLVGGASVAAAERGPVRARAPLTERRS